MHSWENSFSKNLAERHFDEPDDAEHEHGKRERHKDGRGHEYEHGVGRRKAADGDGAEVGKHVMP